MNWRRFSACLWIFCGVGIAPESLGGDFSQLLNQLDEYRSSSIQIQFDSDYSCSGALLNNTHDPGRPLVLTAAHCLEGEEKLGSAVFVLGNEWRSEAGAIVLASSRQLDFALLELKEGIPERFDPVYLGWSKEPPGTERVAIIHSPDFGPAEYAISAAAPVLATFDGIYNAVESGFWRVDWWSHGGTSMGSSGAALLDENFKVIGGLSGSTDWEDSKSDFFFRFDLAYDHFDDPGRQLKAWIDPDELGSTGHFRP